MEKDTNVIPYKLVQHLKEICSEREEYANLLSVWQINRKACHDILENVTQNYPHYTAHDISHSDSIITNIERLLGEQAIRKLSPTDTWLLLQAAYLHDFGMVVLFEDIKKEWETEAFQEYLKELEDSNDHALCVAARYINQLKENMNQNLLPSSWPLHVKRYVTFITADYYRGKHASISKDYLRTFAQDWGLDLSYNGLIPQRLIYLLGEISFLHTEDRGRVLHLDYRANGYGSDYIHPRFVAEMLRLGDLLDVDNNRFNPYIEKVSGERPESSADHIRKHLAATHIMISPTQIEYRADCLDERTYRETQRFVTWLKEEVNFLAIHWLQIMPQEIRGTAPRLKEPELLLRGQRDILGTTDLRFSISQEKAFEVIEGSSIYDDPYVFLREVVQNGLDACKLQLWEDLSNGKFSAWWKGNAEEVKPFDLPQEIFENYRVQVYFQDIDENTLKVIVKDNGIGISKQAFQRICRVGVSYAGDEQWKQTLKKMPRWLKPTAGFGIGLQSVFLVADRFEIFTKSKGEGIHAIVESRRNDGYVQLRETDEWREQGTEVHICVRKNSHFTYRFGGYANEYINQKYDPLTEKNQVISYKLMDIVAEYCNKTLFPVEIFLEEESLFQIKPYQWEAFQEEKGKYLFQWNKEYVEMQLWDKEQEVMLLFTLVFRYTSCAKAFSLKGMDLQKSHNGMIKGVDCKADFYGLDAKKYVTLDRNQLKDEYKLELEEIVHQGYCFFIDTIWDLLMDKGMQYVWDKGEETNRFPLFNYWCQVSLERKEEMLQKFSPFFEQLEEWFRVFERNKEGKYQLAHVSLPMLMDALYLSAHIDSRDWMRFSDIERKEKYAEGVANTLNKVGLPEYSYILIDEDLMEALEDLPTQEVSIVPHEAENIAIYSFSKEKSELLTLHGEVTKRYFLENLVSGTFLNDAKGDRYLDTVRLCIPAIAEYPELAVDQVLWGISNKIFSSGRNIISPISARDIQKLEVIGKEGFIAYITELPAYEKLLDFVEENQIHRNRYSREQIDVAYRRLMRDYLEKMECG